MKIQWPWTKFKEKVENHISELWRKVGEIQVALELARVANFIRIIDYSKGMTLKAPPKPISLEDLLRRIERIEKTIVEINIVEVNIGEENETTKT